MQGIRRPTLVQVRQLGGYQFVLLLLAGDSGGPMLHLDKSFRWTVSGVVSFGPSSCGNIVPGVYTRVDSYTDWIGRQLRM